MKRRKKYSDKLVFDLYHLFPLCQTLNEILWNGWDKPPLCQWQITKPIIIHCGRFIEILKKKSVNLSRVKGCHYLEPRGGIHLWVDKCRAVWIDRIYWKRIQGQYRFRSHLTKWIINMKHQCQSLAVISTCTISISQPDSATRFS